MYDTSKTKAKEEGDCVVRFYKVYATAQRYKKEGTAKKTTDDDSKLNWLITQSDNKHKFDLYANKRKLT